MITKEVIRAIKHNIDGRSAEQLIQSIAPEDEVEMIQKFYYPYYCFKANCDIPTLRGRRKIATQCLVDGRNGLGATSDPFIENFEEVEIDSVIKTCSDQGKLKQSAFRYLTHSLGRRFKALTNFNVAIISQRLVYKLFWGIRFGNQFVIIDSMTGLIHPLEADFSDMKQMKKQHE